MLLTLLTAQAATIPAADQLLTIFQQDRTRSSELAVLLKATPELIVWLVVDDMELYDPAELYREALALDVALEAIGIPLEQVRVLAESDTELDGQAGIWSDGLFLAVDWLSLEVP